MCDGIIYIRYSESRRKTDPSSYPRKSHENVVKHLLLKNTITCVLRLVKYSFLKFRFYYPNKYFYVLHVTHTFTRKGD